MPPCTHKHTQERLKELDKLAAAGAKWAEEERHPSEAFVQCLHRMFLAVLGAHKTRENELWLLLPVATKREPQDTYPWYRSLCSCPSIQRRNPRWDTYPGMEMGPALLPAVMKWLAALQWPDLPPLGERRLSARWQISFMELALDFEPSRAACCH